MPRPLLHPFTRPVEERFVPIVRGEGAVVWDDQGREYVDGMGSLWYCQVGHGRAEIADAVAAQMRTLEAFHTFAPYTNEPAERLAAEVVARSPLPDGRAFLCSSGSEAVDTALKLARLVHGLRGAPERRLIVAREHSYHGVTYGGTSAQGLAPNRAGWGELVPGFVHVPHRDLEALEALFVSRGDEIAAVISEPVQGAGGVFPPPEGYLTRLRRLCDEHGALLIADEVICGFGRLGHWFGSQRFEVRPDLVTFAKGVSSGYQPLGGVLLSRAICDLLEADDQFLLRHGFTFSGHPCACAAGLANLAILEREGLLGRADVIGEHLGGGLRALQDEGRAREVRGVGAIWGVALHEGDRAAAVRDRMLDRGVIARPLPGDVLAWCPPLVIEEAQIDRCLEALRKSL